MSDIISDGGMDPRYEYEKSRRLTGLEAENERLRDEVKFLNKQQQLDNEDAERYRKCIRFNWLHPDYDPTGHAWKEE